MAAFLHNIRRKVMDITLKDKTVDQNYETLKQGFDTLVGLTDTISKRLDAHIGQFRGFNATSDQLTAAFAAILQKAPPDHPYVALSADSKTATEALLKEGDATIQQITDTSVKRVKDLTAVFAQFNARLKQRDEARANYDYYVNKVKKLHESRDKLKASGKGESPKEVEHREQNEKKMDDATNVYNTTNAGIVNDLNHLWEHRFDYLGPILADLMSAELAYAKLFHQQFANLRIPQATSASVIEFKNVSQVAGNVAGGGADAGGSISFSQPPQQQRSDTLDAHMMPPAALPNADPSAPQAVHDGSNDLLSQ